MTRLLCVLFVFACGGKTRAPAHPDTTKPPSAAGSGSAAPVAVDRSEEQCDRLIAHVVTLGAAERPADQKPTEDERTTIQAQMRTAWSPRCKQLTTGGYDCALAAHTLAELDACRS